MTAQLNDWQVQQLLRSNGTLKELNCQAGRLLRKLGKPPVSRDTYRCLGKRCVAVATGINSNLSFRKEVLTPDPARPPDVRFILMCPGCVHKPDAVADEKGIHTADLLSDGSRHLDDLADLLVLGQNVMNTLLVRDKRRCNSSRPPFSEVKQLNDALLRQRREARRTYSWPSGNIQFLGDVCGGCGRPMAEAMRDYPVPAPEVAGRGDGDDYET